MVTATEPAWLAGAREAARARYEALPVPTNREEAWRFTNLRGFDPDAYEAHPGTLTIEGDPAGGVTFGSIARLVAERPELVEPHLGTVVSGDEKFAAGNAARWADGVFLHVPAGVHVAVLLRASLQLTDAGAVALPRADRARARRAGRVQRGVLVHCGRLRQRRGRAGGRGRGALE
jgi:Fe-S cluster assembly protein SufD